MSGEIACTITSHQGRRWWWCRRGSCNRVGTTVDGAVIIISKGCLFAFVIHGGNMFPCKDSIAFNAHGNVIRNKRSASGRGGMLPTDQETGSNRDIRMIVLDHIVPALTNRMVFQVTGNRWGSKNALCKVHGSEGAPFPSGLGAFNFFFKSWFTKEGGPACRTVSRKN